MLLAALGVRDHVDAIDDDAAAVRLHHARQHAHRRGLAGAIGPDQAENLAAVDGETDMPSTAASPGKPLAKPIDGDNGRGRFAHGLPAGSASSVASAGMPGTSSWVGL